VVCRWGGASNRLQTFVFAEAKNQRLHIMSGDGRGVERGATAMMVARGGRSGLKTGGTTKVAGATMVDCEAAQTQQSNE
jgi:hypothetical protein